MLSSLPTLHPPPPHTLWYPSLSAASPAPPSQTHNPSTTNPTTDPHQHNHRTPNTNTPPHGPPHHHHHHHQRTRLSTLRHDESTIRTRKANIRRFGSGWLRPPGVPKTLQGMADERAEREEGEMARAREFALAEAQAAAAEAGAGEGEGEGGVALEGGEEGVEAFERDLDAEVPDADGDGDAGGGGEGVWSDADEEDEAEEEEGLEGAEQTLLEEVEVGGFVAVAGDGGGGVDLDAEVPEAEGSYEHTDTEVEDESSGDEGGPVRGVFGRAGQGLVLGGNGGGGVLGRSVFGSSPVRTGRRGSGRGRGREN